MPREASRDFLDGITHRHPAGMAGFSNPTAPTAPHEHSWLPFKQHRVILEVIGPDGKLKARRDHQGNIMCTWGLDRLVSMLASDTDGASKWASAGAIGTSTTAANSTQDSLGNSTQIVHLSQASMAAARLGARTLEFRMTFASNGQAAVINEVGVFATNNATEKMIARSVLGTDSVNRGTADEIRASYQCIAGTA